MQEPEGIAITVPIRTSFPTDCRRTSGNLRLPANPGMNERFSPLPFFMKRLKDYVSVPTLNNPNSYSKLHTSSPA